MAFVRPGAKRTSIQRQHDRTVIARLYLEGKTQAEIGEQIGVSQQQVAYDLKKIKAEWREQRTFDYTQIQNKQLAKIDLIEQEAWEAFRRSQQPREVITTKKIKGKEP